MTSLKLVLILVIACLIAIFIAQNVAVIEMRFLIWNFLMSRALLAFFALVGGFIIGWFSSSLLCWSRSKSKTAAKPEEKV